MNRREKMTEQVCDITKLFYIISISRKSNMPQLKIDLNLVNKFMTFIQSDLATIANDQKSVNLRVSDL